MAIWANTDNIVMRTESFFRIEDVSTIWDTGVRCTHFQALDCEMAEAIVVRQSFTVL